MCGLTLEEEFIQAAAADHSWPLSHVEQWFILNSRGANEMVRVRRERGRKKKRRNYTRPRGLKYSETRTEAQKSEYWVTQWISATSGRRIHTKSFNFQPQLFWGTNHEISSWDERWPATGFQQRLSSQFLQTIWKCWSKRSRFVEHLFTVWGKKKSTLDK